MKTYPLFTTSPTPAHWVLWFMLAAITLLLLGTMAMGVRKMAQEYLELRRWEDWQRQKNRLTPPRPEPKAGRDEIGRASCRERV